MSVRQWGLTFIHTRLSYVHKNGSFFALNTDKPPCQIWRC